MRRPEAAPRILAAVCAGVYLAIAVYYAVAVPPGGGPDEPDHLQYIDVIARYLRLPMMPGSADEARKVLEAQEAQHPPLFYAVMALPRAVTLRILPGEASQLVLRLLCVLMGLAALFVTWKSSRYLWPNSPWRGAVAVAFLGLLPQTQYMAAVINNSSASLLLGAVVVLLCIRALGCSPWRGRDWLLFGIAPAALLCTKLTGLWVMPLWAICAAAKMRADGPSAGSKALNWLLALLPTVLLLGPWLVRNQLLYGTILPERVSSRRLAGGLVAILCSLTCALELMRVTLPEILLNFHAPYWLLRPLYPRALADPVASAFLALPAMGLAAAVWRRISALKRRPWALRDGLFAGLALSVVLGVALAQYIYVRDTGALFCLGRYAWEAGGGFAVLWTLCMFGFPWRGVRNILLTVSLVAMAVASFWVCHNVLLFYHLNRL